jgi:hypothetical protein
MAPVIWGLPLSEITWSKFGAANMWNRVYHMRRTKFIVYLLAIIFCVVSGALGIDALSRYVSQQEDVESRGRKGISVSNNDYVGVASYNIFAGIYVATIFGAAFFLDLIWPERRESRGVRFAWKACAIAAIFVQLASCIAMTVIVATESAKLTGKKKGKGQNMAAMAAMDDKISLKYRHSARVVASVVFAWIAWVFVVYSTCVLIAGKNHDEQMGPWSTDVREAKMIEMKKFESNLVQGHESGKPLVNPTTGESMAPTGESMAPNDKSLAHTDKSLAPAHPPPAYVQEPAYFDESSAETHVYDGFKPSGPHDGATHA